MRWMAVAVAVVLAVPVVQAQGEDWTTAEFEWYQPDPEGDVFATLTDGVGAPGPGHGDIVGLNMTTSSNGTLVAAVDLAALDTASGELVVSVFFQVAGEAYQTTWYCICAAGDPVGDNHGTFTWSDGGTLVGTPHVYANAGRIVFLVTPDEVAGLEPGVPVEGVVAATTTGVPTPLGTVVWSNDDYDRLEPSIEPLHFTYGATDDSDAGPNVAYLDWPDDGLDARFDAPRNGTDVYNISAEAPMALQGQIDASNGSVTVEVLDDVTVVFELDVAGSQPLDTELDAPASGVYTLRLTHTGFVGDMQLALRNLEEQQPDPEPMDSGAGTEPDEGDAPTQDNSKPEPDEPPLTTEQQAPAPGLILVLAGVAAILALRRQR